MRPEFVAFAQSAFPSDTAKAFFIEGDAIAPMHRPMQASGRARRFSRNSVSSFLH
jgi:hypothetical protein